MTESIKQNFRSVGRKARSVLDFAVIALVIALLTGYGVLFVLEVAKLPLA